MHFEYEKFNKRFVIYKQQIKKKNANFTSNTFICIFKIKLLFDFINEISLMRNLK